MFLFFLQVSSSNPLEHSKNKVLFIIFKGCLPVCQFSNLSMNFLFPIKYRFLFYLHPTIPTHKQMAGKSTHSKVHNSSISEALESSASTNFGFPNSQPFVQDYFLCAYILNLKLASEFTEAFQIFQITSFISISSLSQTFHMIGGQHADQPSVSYFSSFKNNFHLINNTSQFTPNIKCLVLIIFLIEMVSCQSGTEYIESMVRKLLRLCEEEQSIDLFECTPKMIQNDKKIGNFRENFNYTQETVYMMHTYDKNDDGRLDKNQLFNMGIDIASGNVSGRDIKAEMENIEEKMKKKEEEKMKKKEEIKERVKSSPKKDDDL